MCLFISQFWVYILRILFCLAVLILYYLNSEFQFNSNLQFCKIQFYVLPFWFYIYRYSEVIDFYHTILTRYLTAASLHLFCSDLWAKTCIYCYIFISWWKQASIHNSQRGSDNIIWMSLCLLLCCQFELMPVNPYKIRHGFGSIWVVLGLNKTWSVWLTRVSRLSEVNRLKWWMMHVNITRSEELQSDHQLKVKEKV